MGGTYRVDVLKEPLNYPIVWMEFGPVIALADAVALKMGALHDRALPRDVLDAHGASSRFTRTELIAACRAALDDEFSLEMLRASWPSPRPTQMRHSPDMAPDRN